MAESAPLNARKSGLRIDLFCEVIDNFGDAGVCWRLAKQLASEWHLKVRLWIDRLDVLKKICPAVQLDKDSQFIESVNISVWDTEALPDNPDLIPDVVIEGFGTRLPDVYVEYMAAKTVSPVWLNLEYLSAESWVETTHLMQSPHSKLPLTKYFFFPGFTSKTGGLLREKHLIDQAIEFQSHRSHAIEFLQSLGIDCDEKQFIVSLFCYPTAPVLQLLNAFSQDERNILCLIPEGVAAPVVEQFMKQAPVAGTSFSKQPLRIQILPMIEQSQYDRFLWSCDLNFIRGEDSFVRAQWAGMPFIWQIYPQDENAHIEKLNAFIRLYLQGLSQHDQQSVLDFWHCWNSVSNQGNLMDSWQKFKKVLPKLKQHGDVWRQKLSEQSDLASAMVRFVESLR